MIPAFTLLGPRHIGKFFWLETQYKVSDLMHILYPKGFIPLWNLNSYSLPCFYSYLIFPNSVFGIFNLIVTVIFGYFLYSEIEMLQAYAFI